MRLLLGLTLLTVAIPIHAQWVRQKVDTTASFRGLAVVNEKIVWASGTGGTVIRTIDGGKTWNVITVPGAEKLDFRDIEAFDANTAYILSIGNGDLSRIYKTTDGGKTWKLQFKNDDPKKFFDAITCLGPMMCLAVSDPVGGKFPIVRTTDFGEHWNLLSPSKGVESKDGEAAFAASGTCLISSGDPGLWFLVTGGARAMVYRIFIGVEDQFDVQSVDPHFISGPSGAGIFSIARFNQKYTETGVIVGGNYEKPDEHEKNLGLTRDYGETWTLIPGLSGYRSGVAYINAITIVAVGTNGSDITRDNGNTWTVLGKENLNAITSKGPTATWAVGPKGMVVKLK